MNPMHFHEPASNGDSKLIKGLIILIDIFRKYRPNKLRGQCLYEISCTAYAKQALRSHGFCQGLLLSTKRVLSCNARGYDPQLETIHYIKQ